MRKWLKRTLITSGVVLALGGGTAYAFESGAVENWCTHITIPFNLLVGNQHLQNVHSLSSPPMKNVDVGSYKNTTQPLCKLFKVNQTRRPGLDHCNLTDSAQDELNHIFNRIYGVPHTYVANASVTGIGGDHHGWGPIVTFAALDDTKTIKSYHCQLQINNGKITSVRLINTTEALYWPSELPNNYNLANISMADGAVQRIFNNSSLNGTSIQLSDRVKHLKSFYHNGVISGVYATTDPNQILLRYTMGTNSQRVTVNVIYDTASNTIKSIN